MANETLALADGIFEISRYDEAIIAVPAVDLRELDYQRIQEGARKILDLMNDTDIKNVVLDFQRTDYYGSTALSFFLKLWMAIKQRNGRMAFCNISNHEREILRITNLDHIWPICSSRSEALELHRDRAAKRHSPATETRTHA